MRRWPVILLLSPLIAGAAASNPPPDPLAQVRAEQRSAEKETGRLEEAAARARGEAERLRSRQAAAAAAIVAAEAGLSAAELDRQRLAALLARSRERLAERRRPAERLSAGLVTMARRPPLLALAGSGSTQELIRVRQLLGATMPAIRRRSAALAAEVEETGRLARDASAAARTLAESRRALALRQARFAALEREALRRADLLAGESMESGDVAIARGEEAGLLQRRAASQANARRLAGELAGLPPAPPRPAAGRTARPPGLAYLLPVRGRLIEGLGEVSPAGIRSRGLLFATSRGTPVAAPADGAIAFAGPFRSREGVVIVDHGGGWMTLLTGVRTGLAPGERVRLGEPLGHALGEVGVELRHLGRPLSAALIAGSSPLLSNASKES